MRSRIAIGMLAVAIAFAVAQAGGAAVSSPRAGSTVYLPIIARNYPPLPHLLITIQLPSGSHPHGIALDIAGRRAFVGNHLANTLSAIDTASMTLSATIPLANANGPNGVAYHAGLDRVYVANRNTDNLSIVDPTGRTHLQNVAVGALPDGVIVQGGRVYVANFDSDTISSLDVQTNVVSDTLLYAPKPAMLAGDDERGFVYVTTHLGNTVLALGNSQLSTIDSSGVSLPYGIAFDPITYRLYVANRGDNHTVALIDVNPNLPAGTIDVGREPFVVAVNPRTGHVFVVSGDTVQVYDRRDNAPITTIAIGSGAEEGIAVDPVRNLVYVTSGNTDQVQVIQDVPAADIAFVTYEVDQPAGPYSNISIADETGQHVLALTQSTEALELNAQVAWRPDGRRLAFVSSRDPNPYPNPDHNWDVFTMETTGRNQVNLTGEIGVDDQEPDWSPDGSKIAWRSDWSIWTMNADGSSKTQLTSGLTARTPMWSPDGQKIAFIAFVGDPPQHMTDLFVMPTAGGSPINLTNSPISRSVTVADWSPGGSEIAIETDRDSIIVSSTLKIDNWEIYKVNVDTLQLTRLTDDPAQDHGPVWSPDGSRIAFLSDRGNAQYNYSLWLMNADGSSPRRLTGPLGYLGRPAWSPDGTRLAVQVGLFESAEIYLVGADGGAPIRLTNNTVEDAHPAWRPDTW